MKDKKYYAINWTDGVKITKDHFLESYYHTVDTIRNYASTGLNSYNYGLLNASGDALYALEIETYTHTNERLVLRLQACNAITSRGVRINFDTEMYGGDLPSATIEVSDIDTSSGSLEFYVMLTIDPFKLIPVGEPDPDAIPLHHPNVLPKIGLRIVPADQFNTRFLNNYCLVVGRVEWKNGAFIIDNEYVPPVARICYHKELTGFYQKVCNELTQIKDYCLVINNKNRGKYLNNKLAGNTFLLCRKILDFVSQNHFELYQKGMEEPPVFIVNKISILANYLSNELSLMDEMDKEEILQYYYEWIDIKPSIFERVLGEVIEHKYEHLNIAAMIGKVDYLMAVISRLWKKLSELEYIGQRKDNIVISEENMTLRKNTQKRSWSIID